MDELKTLLNQVEDTYYDFVVAVLQYAKKKQSRTEVVVEYIKKNPKANTSDILEFISDQPDFYEDAAFVKAG